MDIRTIDRSALKDIKDVCIDTSKPCEERIKSFVEQIGDPYCYLDNGVVVNIAFSDTEMSLHDRLKDFAVILGTA